MSITAVLVAIAPTELAKLSDLHAIGRFFLNQMAQEDSPKVLDLDTSWQGLHYLLTGSAYEGEAPYSLPILGGAEVGPELVYDAVRCLVAEQVQVVAEALATMDLETLQARYDPAALAAAEIYPPEIWLREGAQGFAYLAEHYGRLQQFYQQSAQRGDAMLLALV